MDFKKFSLGVWDSMNSDFKLKNIDDSNRNIYLKMARDLYNDQTRYAEIGDFSSEFKKNLEYKLISIDDSYVGIISYYVDRTVENVLHISEVWIEPEYRKFSLFSKTVEHLLVSKAPIDVVCLQVLKKNNKAFNVYRHMGFKIELSNEDSHVMRWEL